jgi:hypothetical protein
MKVHSKAAQKASRRYINAVKEELRELHGDKRPGHKVMRRFLRKTITELEQKHRRMFGPKKKTKKRRKSHSFF